MSMDTLVALIAGAIMVLLICVVCYLQRDKHWDYPGGGIVYTGRLTLRDCACLNKSLDALIAELEAPGTHGKTHEYYVVRELLKNES